MQVPGDQEEVAEQPVDRGRVEVLEARPGCHDLPLCRPCTHIHAAGRGSVHPDRALRDHPSEASPGRPRATGGCGPGSGPCRSPPAAVRDRQLAQLRPVVLRDGEVDDPGGLGEVRGEVLLGLFEVVGLDVGGAGGVVAEGFDEHVLVGVVEGARPVEPQAAGLATGGGGELAGDLGPVVGVLGEHLELGGDEDHGGPPVRGVHRVRESIRQNPARAEARRAPASDPVRDHPGQRRPPAASSTPSCGAEVRADQVVGPAPAARRKAAASTTTLVTRPWATGRSPSARATVNWRRRPSTLSSTARTASSAPTGLGARWSSSTRVPTVVAPASRAPATASTVARSARARTRGVASTGTSPLPTAAAVSAPVTVYRKAASRPGASAMAAQPPTWMAGRLPGSGSTSRRTSRVTGAVSPLPNSR